MRKVWKRGLCAVLSLLTLCVLLPRAAAAEAIDPERAGSLTIQAERDTDLWVLPAEVYQELMAASAPLANYTNELMASRFSEVMWLLEQVLWRRLDRRLAAFLLEESAIEGGAVLKITHEAIANHLGTHREVITRMLRYFQTEGMVRLARGTVELLDQARLRRLGEADGA